MTMPACYARAGFINSFRVFGFRFACTDNMELWDIIG